MKLEVVKRAVTSRVGRQILVGKKHSPTFLFAGGIVGVVATTVLASKATLKLDEVLSEAEHKRNTVRELKHKDYSETDRIHDHKAITIQAAVAVTKLYLPAVGVGVLSVAALTGSHVVLSRRNTALMAAYSALDKGFNEYRSRVRSEFGDDKERELRHGTETLAEVIVGEDGETTTIQHKAIPHGSPSVYARFFDELSPSWCREPEYNKAFLNCQQNYANDLLHSRGHVFLNEVYDMLGITRSKAGAVVGWVLSKDSDNYIDFGIFDGNTTQSRLFVNGLEKSILLDFNVDGVIYDKI